MDAGQDRPGEREQVLQPGHHAFRPVQQPFLKVHAEDFIRLDMQCGESLTEYAQQVPVGQIIGAEMEMPYSEPTELLMDALRHSHPVEVLEPGNGEPPLRPGWKRPSWIIEASPMEPGNAPSRMSGTVDTPEDDLTQ